MTNNLTGTGTDAVTTLRPNDVGWTAARRVSVTSWPDPAPTAVAHTPAGDYVINGRLDRLLAGDRSVEKFTLRRR